MGKFVSSDFLFARPNALSGAARLMDLAGQLDGYNRTSDPDVIALAADWNVVGQDLRKAILDAADQLAADAR